MALLAFALFLNLGRIQPLGAELLDGLCLGGGGHGAGELFTFGVKGGVGASPVRASIRPFASHITTVRERW